MRKRIPGEPAQERQQVIPLARPVYTFEGQPTPDALRQMAVRCMRDQLDIMWRAPHDLIFSVKPGRWNPNSKEKTTSYLGGKIYHGLPYVRGATAIPQWYEYYNEATGELDFNGDGTQLWSTLGHSCASCVLYSWRSVCTSLSGRFAQRFMVPKRGCIPVAPCKIPEDIETYMDYSTGKIIEDNGRDVIYEAYANVKPADAVNTQPNNHVMMAIAPAHVERNADGTIDPIHSYITVQDQRSGNKKQESGFYEYLENGIVERYTGRLSCDISFQKLCDEGYIPLTAAEFMGTKPYEKAEARLEGSTATRQELLDCKICSNYPVCVVRIRISDFETRQELNFRKILKTDDICDIPSTCYPLALLEDALSLWSDRKVNIRVEAVLTTNEVFTVLDTTI